MPIQRYSITDVPEVAWSNGAGTTRSIVRWPARSTYADFDWSASIATLAGDAEFSAFPDVDRTSIRIEGDAVELIVADVAHALETDAPFRFDGAASTRSRMSGRALAFNAMSRRGRVRHALSVVRASTKVDARSGALHALSGRWRISDSLGGPHALEPGEGLWWADRWTSWTASTSDADARLVVLACSPS